MSDEQIINMMKRSVGYLTDTPIESDVDPTLCACCHTKTSMWINGFCLACWNSTPESLTRLERIAILKQRMVANND